MGTTTLNKRHVVAIALAAGALTILAPVAQADVVDRALVAQHNERTAMLDARERSMQTRPERTRSGGPDAFERALITHAAGIAAQTTSTLDARERVLGPPLGASSPVVTGSGFAWDAFGIGAGVGIGFIFVILGLGLGVLAMRHGDGRVANS